MIHHVSPEVPASNSCKVICEIINPYVLELTSFTENAGLALNESNIELPGLFSEISAKIQIGKAYVRQSAVHLPLFFSPAFEYVGQGLMAYILVSEVSKNPRVPLNNSSSER